VPERSMYDQINGQRRFTFKHADETYRVIDVVDTLGHAFTSEERQDQKKEVPPPGSLLVLLYDGMIS